jgi:hypothetical protein
MPKWNLDSPVHRLIVSFLVLVLVGAAFFGGCYPLVFNDIAVSASSTPPTPNCQSRCQFPELYLFTEITISAPSVVSVGQMFVISGTSYQSAAERVNLHITDLRDPIGYAVVKTSPPYTFQFNVIISNNGLSVNGVTVYNGTTSGRTFYFFVVSHQSPYNISPLAGISVQG